MDSTTSKQLVLGNFHLRDEEKATKLLPDFLESPSYLPKSVIIKACYVGKECLKTLFKKESIKSLCLWDNAMPSDTLQVCLLELATSSIEEFRLIGSAMGPEEMACLTVALRDGSLKRLFLEQNDISYLGFTLLMQALRDNRSLTTFGFNCNYIDDWRLMKFLAEAILPTNIQKIHLERTKVSREGVEAFKKAMLLHKKSVEIFWDGDSDCSTNLESKMPAVKKMRESETYTISTPKIIDGQFWIPLQICETLDRLDLQGMIASKEVLQDLFLEKREVS